MTFTGRVNKFVRLSISLSLRVFTDPLPPEIVEASPRLFLVLEGFALICRQHGIICAVQLFPQRYQVQTEEWTRAVEA